MNELMRRLHLKVPLMVAPMAGGPSSPEFVVASIKAGALGSLGAAYSKPSDIEDLFLKVRSKTLGPLGINLFIPDEQPHVSEVDLLKAIKATEKWRHQFSLPAPTLHPPYEENFDHQFEMVLKLKPEVFSFVFGALKPDYVKAARREKIFLIGAATTLEEALALEESGIDALVLQGVEAGGHRAIFDSQIEDPQIGIKTLLNLCKTKLKVPLIAAGGIMTSEDIKFFLSQGASAVQMGTAFLNCQEAGTSASYRQALSGTERKTKLTRAFSGRLARGIENLFMKEMEKHLENILPFQAQNKFTRDLRSASAKAGSSDFLSLWAGTGAGKLWTGSVADLIQNLFKD